MASFDRETEKLIKAFAKRWDVPPSRVVTICVAKYLPVLAALDEAAAVQIVNNPE